MLYEAKNGSYCSHFIFKNDSLNLPTLLHAKSCSCVFDSLCPGLLTMQVRQHLSEQKSVASLDDRIAHDGLHYSSR